MFTRAFAPHSHTSAPSQGVQRCERVTPLSVAQHEAAHVVVGVALGLRLRRATLAPRSKAWLGYAWFPHAHGARGSIMYAAGLAWERVAGNARWAGGDVECLRKRGHSRLDINAFARAAEALLSTRSVAHARVTRALVEHTSITAHDVYELACYAHLDRQ